MPNARVGAMPLPSQSKDQKKGRRSKAAKQKGITMEDLKKQTAIRLANEQHHPNSTAYNGPVDVRHEGVVPQYPDANYRHNYGQDTIQQPQGTPTRAPAYPQDGYGGRIGYGMQGHGIHPIIVRPQHPHGPPADLNFSGEVPSSPHGNRSHAISSGSSSSFTTAAAQDSTGPLTPSRKIANAAQMCKLPHGLTVQELKEMTKARLQSEAQPESEQPSRSAAPSPFQQQAPFPVAQQPIPQQPAPEPVTANRPLLSASRGPFAFFTKISGRSGSSVPVDNVQTAPPGFQSIAANPRGSGSLAEMTQASGTGRETWHQQSTTTMRSEGWETASYTSMNSGSEHFGSEPVYSSGNQQRLDDYSEVHFGRSRSYPSSSSAAFVNDAESVSSSNSMYETSTSGYPGARGRSFTLSPHSGLSHLHEDRPLVTSVENLSVPSFDSSMRSPIGVGIGRSPDVDGFGPRSFSASDSIGFSGNRERAVSAPALFSSPEELLSEDSGLSRRISAELNRPGSSQDLARSTFGSVLGSSLSSGPGTDLSSVFRSTGEQLLAGLESMSSAALGGATWGNDTIEAIASQPSSSDEDITLVAGGLSAMLNLSGTGTGSNSDNSFLSSLRVDSSTRDMYGSDRGSLVGSSSFPSDTRNLQNFEQDRRF